MLPEQYTFRFFDHEWTIVRIEYDFADMNVMPSGHPRVNTNRGGGLNTRHPAFSVSFIHLREYPGQPLNSDDTFVAALINNKDIAGIVLFHQSQRLDSWGVGFH